MVNHLAHNDTMQEHTHSDIVLRFGRMTAALCSKGCTIALIEICWHAKQL